MIIIPARIGSTRFPNKVLAEIQGIPMVIRTAMRAKEVDEAIIATDSPEVVAIAEKYGIRAILTSEKHQSGTDRIFEAAQIAKLEDDTVIINLQGDEPFIETEVIQTIRIMSEKNRSNPEILINSAYKQLTNPEADDPNIVKVVTDEREIALYFSRSKIPYPRDHHFDSYKGHIGIYGFTMRTLKTFCSLPPAPLEEIEKLEQLRALYHGYKIAMSLVETQSFGIDTQEDLIRALRHHTL